ncbi:unnamed protein product [Closterium sp. Yama58-4]|nr:unnamed protein product [Closterium sp. Yama58-4]
MDSGRRAPAGRGGELSSLEDDLLFSVLRRLDCRSDKLAAALVCKRWLAVIRGAYTQCTILNVGALKAILACCPLIQDLNCSKCIRVRDEHVVAIAKRFGPSLQRLNLASNKRIGQAALEAIGAHCTQLHALWLTNGTFDDAALMPIASCHQLKVLGLGNCRSITDMGVCCIAAGCKAVQEVSLRWCVGVTDRGVDVLLSNCHAIHTLDLSYTKVTEAAMRVVQRHPSLTHLNLSSCQSLTDPAIATLRHGCTALQSLDVSGCEQVTDVGLMALTAGAIPLTALTAAFCPQVSDNLLAVLPRFPSLRPLAAACPNLLSLDITCCSSVTDATLLTLSAHCRRLACVRMEACRGVSDAGLVGLFQHCTALSTLDLTDCGISDTTVQGLRHCPLLQSLKLGFDMDITDAGLISLAASCSSLTELDLYRCEGVSCAGIASVAQACTGLSTLNLSYCHRVRDAALIAIARHCPRLRNLECTGVDDAGFIALAHGCPDLQQANLSYTSISDAGLGAMAGMACMTKFNLVHCSRLSMPGLEAALTRCVGLKKVKLLQAWRPLLSPQLLADLEESGCRFRWMDKPPLEALRA